jgi:hypothetical protein
MAARVAVQILGARLTASRFEIQDLRFENSAFEIPGLKARHGGLFAAPRALARMRLGRTRTPTVIPHRLALVA